MINPKILTCSVPNCERQNLPNSLKCGKHEKRPTILKSLEELKKEIDKKK
jgi:hypothetical protein